MIPRVVLDPSFFWLFSESDTEEKAIDLWDLCRPWLKDAKHGVPLLVHSKSVERLREHGLIPAFEGMKELVNRLNLNHVVSPQELSRVVDKFLSNMVTLEEVAPVQDAVFENPSFDPDEFETILQENLKLHSVESAVLSALNAAVGFKLQYAFPRLSTDSACVKAIAGVSLYDAQAGTVVPSAIDHSMTMLREPNQFRASLDPHEIWSEAVCDDEIKFAIGLMAERLTAESLPAFEIGKNFVASLKRNQAFGVQPMAASTLVKCAQALANVPDVPVNEFMTEPAGNKAAVCRIRVRDQAKAYRVHVTTSGVGLRLMIWKTPANVWEFANVGPKNEEKIDAG